MELYSFQDQELSYLKDLLKDLLAISSVIESLLPSRNFLCPAEMLLERTYLPSLERLF
jgi:hypothetical protein